MEKGMVMETAVTAIEEINLKTSFYVLIINKIPNINIYW
ncbi:hypothetical protein BH10BAC3_BH10BAC3_39000 [soil metagenome]